jgi:putative endopeptidase
VILSTPIRTIANYVALQIVQELLPYMPESYLSIRRPLMIYLKGIMEEKPLWERCVKRTDDAFGFATGRIARYLGDEHMRCACLGALFITKAFDRTSKKKIEQIVEEIRLTFIETLPKIEWMDVETRRRAQIKAALITGDCIA